MGGLENADSRQSERNHQSHDNQAVKPPIFRVEGLDGNLLDDGNNSDEHGVIWLVLVLAFKY